VHLEVRHLKLVMAVAEERTLTKAGDRLHLTQSALSHQLRDIEERLDVKLFRRLNKLMILTEAGEILLRSARLVVSELEQAEENLSRISRGQSGSIRISTECYTCYHWLPPVLKVFNQRFPQVEVRIDADATRRPVKALLDGRLDLAIVSRQIADTRLRYEPLFEDELVVIMRPDHRLARRRYIQPADLADERIIVYTIPDSENSLFQNILYPAGVYPKSVSRVQLTEAIIELVKAGLGISVMARWAVAPQIGSGALAALPLTSRGCRRQWSAAMIRDENIPRYMLEFIELVAENSLNSMDGVIELRRKKRKI
jgi:LysR family transcriptional regulator, regulator for metE and metH